MVQKLEVIVLPPNSLLLVTFKDSMRYCILGLLLTLNPQNYNCPTHIWNLTFILCSFLPTDRGFFAYKQQEKEIKNRGNFSE